MATSPDLPRFVRLIPQAHRVGRSVDPLAEEEIVGLPAGAHERTRSTDLVEVVEDPAEVPVPSPSWSAKLRG